MTCNKAQHLVRTVCPSPSLIHYLAKLLFTHAVLELELSRHADVVVRGLWVSHSGEHTVVALQFGSAHETYYMHASWKKSKILSKLKGVAISCVGWNKQTQSDITKG